MSVEFGDGREPWSIDRARVKRWQHCLVRSVAALPEAWRTELQAWLSGRGVGSQPASLLVTRGEDGHRVHVTGGAFDVELDDLPAWLREPTPVPVAKKAAKPKA